VFLPPPDELPTHIAFGTSATAFVRSQAAVRAPAAWSARDALGGRLRPTLVLADYFGDGVPGADNARTSDHGYMVLGITSGTFDAVGSGTVASEAVTGMFPATLPVRVADIHAGLAGAVLHDRMLELVEGAPRQVVMNTSLGGWPCATLQDAAQYCTVGYATQQALVWIEKVRGTDPSGGSVSLEGRFLHATSAGNVDSAPGPLGAHVNSEWSAAAQITPLVDPNTGAGVPNLTNTLVVENFTATTTEPFRPVCLAASAEAGGTIAGVGAPVHSFDSPSAARTFADGGASAATPQVAALAAYVWTLRPSLTPQQLGGLLERNARPAVSCATSTGVIDAYAALLAADVGNAARPVRLAVLDAADSAGDPGADGRFDGNDLDELLRLFTERNGQIDYGRGDLNGDGVTRNEPGVQRREPVDLDADETPEVVVQDLEGLPVRFDERALTDENVLCYFAYSPLWLGPLDLRAEKLGLGNCVDLELDHTFPQEVRAGESNTLTVTASSLAIVGQDGQPLGQEDVFLELDPSNGTTLGADSGTTNADGVFTTTATLAEGHQSLTIEVKAFDREGGVELASGTVTAQLLTPGTAVIDEIFAHITVRAGFDDGDDYTSSGTWSMSGSAGEGGASASVNGSATLEVEDGIITYAGAGTLSANAVAGPGAAVGIDSTLTVTVSGGPVVWNVRQRVTGTFPPPPSSGCRVRFDGQPIGFSGNAGGLMEPGTHSIMHDCGGGVPNDGLTEIDATMEFTVTIGD
jgi:hypothetical protein